MVRALFLRIVDTVAPVRCSECDEGTGTLRLAGTLIVCETCGEASTVARVVSPRAA